MVSNGRSRCFIFDLREFTLLSENRLPYDVVFLLNRLFDAVGDAIHAEAAGSTATPATA